MAFIFKALPKFNMEPKNDGFQQGISYSRVPRSGSMLNCLATTPMAFISARLRRCGAFFMHGCKRRNPYWSFGKSHVNHHAASLGGCQGGCTVQNLVYQSRNDWRVSNWNGGKVCFWNVGGLTIWKLKVETQKLVSFDKVFFCQILFGSIQKISTWSNSRIVHCRLLQQDLLVISACCWSRHVAYSLGVEHDWLEIP